MKPTIRFDRLDADAAVYTLTRADGTTEEIRQPFSTQPAHYGANNQPIWFWDGNITYPTLAPSFHHTTADGLIVHLFLVRGAIVLAPDSTVAANAPEPAEPAEIQQQPDPVPAAGDIWADILLDARHGRTVTPELLGLMSARRQQGVARYGTPLQIANLRDARSDAIQEALDAVAYCECRRQQLAPTDPTGALGWSYAREDAQRLAQRMLELP